MKISKKIKEDNSTARKMPDNHYLRFTGWDQRSEVLLLTVVFVHIVVHVGLHSASDLTNHNRALVSSGYEPYKNILLGKY